MCYPAEPKVHILDTSPRKFPLQQAADQMNRRPDHNRDPLMDRTAMGALRASPDPLPWERLDHV